MKSKTFSQNQLKLVFYFNVLNFYGLKYHKISIELYFKFFLCFYFAGFLLSTLLHLSLFQAPKLPFFFFSEGEHSFSLGEHSQSHFLQPILCHILEKIQELSLVILARNGANFEVTLFLHVSFINFYKNIKL